MGSYESVPARLLSLLEAAKQGRGLILVLTGAGISAESGIPTFRGPEGYWKVGSRNYFPEELATRAAFLQMPEEIWAWYLWRRGVCSAAEPNAAHRALVELEAHLGERFLLVTQNVDGLHRRAGSSKERTYEIHGRIDEMRCFLECSPALLPVPAAIPLAWAKDRRLDEDELALLRCPSCGGRMRPHVLWFDESYDEERYHLMTVRALAARSALVVIAGTSAQTNLPWQVVSLAERAGATIIDINLEDNPFGDIASRSGGVVRAPAARPLARIAEILS